MNARLDKLLPFAVSFTVTSAFFINLCAWIFECGCHALWAGADAMCNIHAAQGRHCPWCSHGTTGYVASMVVLSLPQLAVSVFAPWGRTVRMATAVALFPLVGLLFALVSGWYDGYW